MDDTLRLQGAQAGVLAGLGSAFAGFTSVDVAANASWTLNGANTLGTGTALAVDGKLNVAGALTDTGSVTVANGAVLAAAGTLQLASLVLTGGTLDGSAGGAVLIGAGTAASGAITVAAGATVSGSGTITGAPINDAGLITGTDHNLELGSAISGSGTLSTGGAFSRVIVDGACSVAHFDFTADGVLDLQQPMTFSSTISGFGTGDVILFSTMFITNLSYADGVLTATSGISSSAFTLTFAGDYTLANFKLDFGKIVFVGPPGAPLADAGIGTAGDVPAVDPLVTHGWLDEHGGGFAAHANGMAGSDWVMLRSL